MTPTRARLILLVLAGAILMWAGYLKTSRVHDLPQGQIDVEVAPAGADISIDGQKWDSGLSDIDIGPHKIRVSLDGFKPHETTVDVTQAEKAYVGVVLRSGSDDTKGWYTDHPDDQKIAEGIGDHVNDSRNQGVSTKYPIFSRLPAVFGDGHDGLIKIESEAALEGAGKPSIGVYAAGPQQRRVALEWIQSRGYLLSDIDVVFYGASIPLETRLPL
jgi:hypothetical protein